MRRAQTMHYFSSAFPAFPAKPLGLSIALKDVAICAVGFAQRALSRYTFLGCVPFSWILGRDQKTRRTLGLVRNQVSQLLDFCENSPKRRSIRKIFSLPTFFDIKRPMCSSALRQWATALRSAKFGSSQDHKSISAGSFELILAATFL